MGRIVGMKRVFPKQTPENKKRKGDVSRIKKGGFGGRKIKLSLLFVLVSLCLHLPFPKRDPLRIRLYHIHIKRNPPLEIPFLQCFELALGKKKISVLSILKRNPGFRPGQREAQNASGINRFLPIASFFPLSLPAMCLISKFHADTCTQHPPSNCFAKK